MPGKQLAPQEVMQAPVAPAAPSLEEAIGLFGEVASEAGSAIWGAVESVASGAADAVGDAADAVGGLIDSATEAVGGAIDAGMSAVDSAVDAAVEFATQSAHIRLAHLYGTLGATDPFLQAIYDDAELLAAADDLVPADILVGFMAHPTLSDGLVERAPTEFAAQFDGILNQLSVGSAMPATTRRGLRRMLPGMTLPQAMASFGKRFNHAMEDDSGAWTADNIRLVWDQLEVLPDQDVSDLTVLTTFQAITGSGGFGPSWEAPDTVNTIQLGEDHDPATLGHTVRHEVGHAVHAEIPSTVNAWLSGEINFWFYEGNDAGYESWITDLGGFPSEWVNAAGEDQAFGNDEKADVLAMLSSFVGAGGSWSPTRATVDDGLTPDEAALWAAMPEAVQNAVTGSPAYWYTNYNNWQAGAKGQYFLNYWYQRPFWMSATAKQAVDATGDDYTAMSEKEFFANCYAEYFEDPAGYTDNSLWGGSLPGSVQSYFARHIVERQPYEAPPDAGEAGAELPAPPRGDMAGTP